MRKYRLVIEKASKVFLSSLTSKEKNRIFDKLLLLSSGQWDLCDIKRMQGVNPLLYRLRVGKYRIIYEKHDDILSILIMKIGSRGDIYK